jgi:signal transduction histidine kinase
MKEATAELLARLRAAAPDLAGEVEALGRDLDKQAALVEDAHRLRSAFLQNLSHEVRTPVTVMRGLLDVLAHDVGGGLSDEQRDLIDRATHSSQQVLDLIEGVLALSRAEAGTLEARRSRVFLPDLFTDLVRGVEAQLRKKGVELVVDLPRGIDWISVDGRLLQSLVAQLLSNAVKFTASGSVRFQARLLGGAPAAGPLRAAEPSGDTLEIVVEDTGEGIPDDLARRIFEPFRQVDGSTRRRHEGLGIGLSVAERTAEALGATIELDSRLGQGTRVRVCVPLIAVEGLESAPSPAVSRLSPALPLESRGALTDLANLALVFPGTEAQAIAFALDLLDRQLRCEVAFYADIGAGGGATIVDLLGHADHGLGPGSAAPLATETIARLATERRTLREDRPGAGSWIVNGVFVDAEECIGALAARLPARRETDEQKILQVAAGWLGRELGRARRSREHAELVASIGRDLKKPLGAALAHTQALVRGLHGNLVVGQRAAVLEIERAVHRVILSTLDLLDYERATGRGFEVARRPYSLESVIDHVLSRQGAAIELGAVRVRKEVAPDLPVCVGDLPRTDRALAIVIHALLEALAEPRELLIRTSHAADHVILEITSMVRAPAPFLDTFSASTARPELGETLGLRIARGWVEAQGGRLSAASQGLQIGITFVLPCAAH